MFVNLIVWLVLVALVVLIGLLTVRAARARSWLMKIPGVLFAGVFTLIFLLVVVVAGKGLARLYVPTPEPAPNLKIEATTEQIARGRYLANIGCAGCHGDKEEFPLTGGFDLAKEIPMPIGSIAANNITSGGILKDRTDGELFRAIRHGYGKDGALLAFMSLMQSRNLSDDDTKSVIAFLRSQPAAGTPQGGDNINLLGAILFGAGLFPSPEPINKNVITAPARGVNAEYGKYVATFGDCRGCHGADMTGAPPSSVDPAGVPNARPFVASLTREQFVQMMRTGKRPDGRELKMPWKNASRMDDQDLSALYEYVKKAP